MVISQSTTGVNRIALQSYSSNVTRDSQVADHNASADDLLDTHIILGSAFQSENAVYHHKFPHIILLSSSISL
ncbi:hypothetical protein Mapa_005229 [Marchantia paleacea]|nr:hypothetical protein Mapa_005229 [Marchantia paleacea]